MAMIFLIVFSISLCTVLLCSPTIKQLGLRWGLIDHPDARKLHQQVMVRAGGISIALGTMLAAILGLIRLSQEMPTAILPHTATVMLVAGCFFLIGLADDRWSLSPILRLGFQLSITVLVWAMGLQIHYLPIPGLNHIELGILSLPITFLWLAGVTNAINWLDGLDGLATGISIIIALTFALIGWQQDNPTIVILAISLAGAGFGFFRYNAMPAQMYMGDSGSYFIGGMLSSIGVLIPEFSSDFHLNAMPYVALAVPIIDMLLVIVSRLLDGKSPFFPDQRHIHHRLLRLAFSKQKAVWIIYGLTVWAGISANLIIQYHWWGWLNVIALTGTIALFNRTALQTTAAIPLNSQATATLDSRPSA